MKKGILKKLFSVATIATIGFGLVSCGEKAESAVDKLTEIKEKGTLVVGLSADYAPYEFHIINENGDDEIVGFDISIAEEIAKDIGVELKIKDMDFDSLVTGVSTGKIDMVISGMTPTEERKEAIDFSDIYYVAEHGIVVRGEDKDKYKTFEDLKGQKVGAQLGSIQEGIAETEIPEADVQSLTAVTDLVLGLKSGKIEALVVELPVAEMIVKNNKGLAIGEVTFKDEEGGSAIGLSKGSEELLEVVNSTITRINEDSLLDEFIVEANELAENQVEE